MSDTVVISVEAYDLLHLGLDTSARMLEAIRDGLKDAGVSSARVFNDIDDLANSLRRLRACLMQETDRTPVGID